MLPESLRYPPLGRPWLLYGLLGTSLVFNLALVTRLGSTPASSDATVAVLTEQTAVATAVAVSAPVQVIGEETDISNPPVPADAVAPLPEPLGVATKAGTSVFSGVVTQSLSATFAKAEVKSPAALSAVYSRLFVWDVDLKRDLQKGDRVEVLYEAPNGAEPLVLAARLRLGAESSKERVVDAFRYQAQGDRFPSYWSSTGTEVPRRLIDGPLADYEQITSLLKDRPTHAGMDFKTPIGTEVVAPRAGKVTRTNWNHAANGNCIEVKFSDGTLAKFLHLNENNVKEGQAVTAGQVIGISGNTGHSTGAHLHYQLDRSGKVTDPVKYHGTLQRKLPPELMEDFGRTVKELSVQLDSRVASL